MRLIFSVILLLPLVYGCSSASNQKITSPLIGWCNNQWTVVYIVQAKPEDMQASTNFIPKTAIALATGNGVEQPQPEAATSQTRRIIRPFQFDLGSGAGLVATIDNQILVGREMGNSSSNSVAGSASVPISF